MLTFKYAFNGKKWTDYLGLCHGKPFLPHLISKKLLQVRDGMRIKDQWALPFPPQKFNPSVSVCACSALQEKKKRSLSKCTYIYIYITHYTLFGSLDLMGQSSELGWAHKKSSNNMCPIPYGPQCKN